MMAYSPTVEALQVLTQRYERGAMSETSYLSEAEAILRPPAVAGDIVEAARFATLMHFKAGRLRASGADIALIEAAEFDFLRFAAWAADQGYGPAVTLLSAYTPTVSQGARRRFDAENIAPAPLLDDGWRPPLLERARWWLSDRYWDVRWVLSGWAWNIRLAWWRVTDWLSALRNREGPGQ